MALKLSSTDMISVILFALPVLILFNFSSIMKPMIESYSSFGSELPGLTLLAVGTWFPQAIGLMSLVLYCYQWYGWVKEKYKRIQLVITFSFSIAYGGVLVCIFSLFLPMFSMAGAVGNSNYSNHTSSVNQIAEPDNILEINRKLIKNGEISFKTKSISDTEKHIRNAVKKFEGYVSEEKEDSYSNKNEKQLTIRIPFKNFDGLLSEISELIDNKYDTRHIKTQDVTEKYIDLEARIRVKKDLENRYGELLAKAESVKDMISIEQQIGIIREDIESAEGNMRYLQDRIAYSTLNIIFYEIVSKPIEFSLNFKNGIKNGWKSIALLCVEIVNIWPFILLIGIVVIFGFWNCRKESKKEGKVLKSTDQDQ